MQGISNLFAVYRQLYIRKVMGAQLSREVQEYIETSGKDIEAITQKFIIDRSDTAYFMQPITMSALEAYPCRIIGMHGCQMAIARF